MFIVEYFLNFVQPLTNFYCMQYLLKEEGFRTAGKCARLKPQQSLMIVRHVHSDGLAPYNMGVSLISSCYRNILTLSLCLFCLSINAIYFSARVLFCFFSTFFSLLREGVKDVCLLIVLQKRQDPLVLLIC